MGYFSDILTFHFNYFTNNLYCCQTQRVDTGQGTSNMRDHNTSLNIYSAPAVERKKIKPKKKNKVSRPTHDVRAITLVFKSLGLEGGNM